MKMRLLAAAILSAGLALSSAAHAKGTSTGSVASSSKHQVVLTRVTAEYWRVTFHNPPFNIFGPQSIGQLDAVITQIERDPKVKVVVFDSDVPNFFLTHYDFVPPLSDTTGLPNGPTGLPPLPDMLVRLSKAPVVSIASIRGRATGVGSELALASDMRFASREKALLSQWEIGAGLVPGGGPMARLPSMMGRGRALEVLLTGNDIDADLAELYGYVNRSLPDAELDRFVDTMARRIARFDKQAIRDIKHRVDVVSLPSNEQIGAGWDGFISSVKRPQAQQRIQRLMKMGLQQNADVEKRLAHYTGTLGDSPK